MIEEGWLIEIPGPRWFSIINGEADWSENANNALRFARKEDAETLKTYWGMDATVTQHIWDN